MQDNSTTPLKRCTVCSNEFPATPEYFYINNRYDPPRLRGACKSCHADGVNRTRDPEKRAEYSRQWAENNREKRRDSCRRWRSRNIEGQRERERVNKRNNPSHSKKAREWEKMNPERKKRTRSEWAKNNRSKLNAMHHHYLARKRRLPGNFLEEDWQFALDYFDGRCAVCGRPPGFFHTLAMDHWVAISNPDCPGTIPTNIVPLCHGNEGCNNSKRDNDPYQWLNQKYGAKKAGAISNRIHEYFSLVRKLN